MKRHVKVSKREVKDWQAICQVFSELPETWTEEVFLMADLTGSEASKESGLAALGARSSTCSSAGSTGCPWVCSSYPIGPVCLALYSLVVLVELPMDHLWDGIHHYPSFFTPFPPLHFYTHFHVHFLFLLPESRVAPHLMDIGLGHITCLTLWALIDVMWAKAKNVLPQLNSSATRT